MALLGNVSAKDHFINDDKVVQSEHQIVRASSKICELCFFDDTEFGINDSTNKFCATISGDMRMGFEWEQSFEKYDKTQQKGKVEIDLKFYSKQSLELAPIIHLDKLMEQTMTFDLDEFYIQHVSSLKYHIFKTMLCMDVYTETQEYTIRVENNMRFVECFKVLVSCLFDFGQFAVDDSLTTTKPYGPFAKVLDDCSLGSSQTKTIKEYKPLLNDNTRTQYWVGDGTYDTACWPGNLLIELIDVDHYMEIYGIPINLRAFTFGSKGPQTKTPTHEVPTDRWTKEEFLGTLWNKAVVYEYVRPAYDAAVLQFLDVVRSAAEVYPMDNEEGAYTVFEAKAEDYLPLAPGQE